MPKLRIARPHEMGFPARLLDKVVEAEPHAEGFRLTARENAHLIVNRRWIDKGFAEVQQEDEVDYSAAMAAAYAHFAQPAPQAPPVIVPWYRP